MELLASPVFWIIFGLVSELIALSPLKENSVVQIAIKYIRKMKPKR